MNSRAMSTLAIAGFLLLGAVCLGLRYYALQEQRAAFEETLWLLTYDASFESDSDGAQVYMAVPYETRYIELVGEETIHPGLEREERGRSIILSSRQARRYDVVNAEFELRLTPSGDRRRQPALEDLTSDAYLRYTGEEDDIQTTSDIVKDIIQVMPEAVVTRTEQVQWIFEYCRRTIDLNATVDWNNAEMALTNKVGTPLGRARAMVALCRALKIPARLVTGFEVRELANVQAHVWVEVFLSQTWVPYDPEFGYSQTLPVDYLPVRRGGHQVIRPVGTVSGTFEARYSIARLPPDELVLQAEMRRPTQIFDLRQLPVPMHNVMSLLLLLPFAALITAIMRNVVGLHTFGTFAPALLAMSFIFADWETGLAILIVVITAGLVGRGFLEKLRLLMVPRLSIILTIVILCVVFGVSLLDYLELTPSAQAVLLPLVILTIMIERFHVTTEEDGWMYALQLTAGTLVVAALCYLVLGWENIGKQVLVYPEVHFLTIAAFIVLGRYAGYRLTELWRFRDMVESPEAGR